MGRTTFVDWGLVLLVGALSSIAGSTACSDRSSSAPKTGILLEISLADNAASQNLDKKIDRIEFSVAYEAADRPDEYVLISAQPEPVREVSGRSLLSEPWKELLVPQEGAGTKVQVVVSAKKEDGTLLALGKLKDPEYQEFIEGKIASRTVLLNALPPGQSPFLVTDTGCVLRVETGKVLFHSPSDYDCDGYKSKDIGGNDCNDFDPDVHPGKAEDCTNGIDDDCNGKTDLDDDTDADEDGYSKCGGDCDDNDKAVHPDAEEKCDGRDDNCDGWCDGSQQGGGEARDSDQDGWNTCGTWRGPSWDRAKCAPVDSDAVDCMDDKADVHPYAEEKCDGKDNDCDGTTDDLDQDGDGANDCGEDCDPADPKVHPGAREICNGKDDDCDGWCDASPATLSEVNWDMDEDGWTSCGSHISTSQSCSDETDCNDHHAWIFPGAPELCDGYDTDCNPTTAVVFPSSSCYAQNESGACVRGTTTCDDQNPDDPWPCDLSNSDSEDPLPERICHDYETCYDEYKQDPAGSPLPFDCINGRYQWKSPVACPVYYTNGDNNLCAEPAYKALPECPGCNSCPWHLFVPGNGRRWSVYFGLKNRDPMAAPENKGASFDPCQGDRDKFPVLVVDPADSWSTDDVVTVYLIWEPDQSAPPAQVMKLTIAPMSNGHVCIEPTLDARGMTCYFPDN